MGRQSKPRANYRQDAITVHRIIGALELDQHSEPSWVEEVSKHLNSAMVLLLNHKIRKSSKKASAA